MSNPHEVNDQLQQLLDQAPQKKSFFRVALYTVVMCLAIVAIVIVLLLIRKSDASEAEELKLRLNQREKELSDATRVIAQLRAAPKQKKFVDLSNPLEQPVYEGVEQPKDVSSKRPNKEPNTRKELLEKMNRKRETVADMLLKEEQQEVPVGTNVKYKKEETSESEIEESEEDEEEEQPKRRPKQKKNNKQIDEALLSSGGVD
jgi:hypothetical protein